VDLYTKVAFQNARSLTNAYSSSFSLSSRLFSKEIRHHIYAIYGLARIADEIVDTYREGNAERKLNDLEVETYHAIEDGYSTNLIVHAFAYTAQFCDMPKDIVQAFFTSMRMDLKPQNYTKELYQKYIYGSAEVIGLMCLRVFCEGDVATYKELAPGAQKLGSAYQKVNFLRDISADYKELGRLYFPGLSYGKFSEADKRKLIQEITKEFNEAEISIRQLPKNGRAAVTASYIYYRTLLSKLEAASVADIKNSRIRINNAKKMAILSYVYIKSKLGLV
jgi:phytoene synthase